MFSLNVQSLLSKYKDLKELISYLGSNQCSPDVIFLQETWKIVDSAYFSLPNYSPLCLKSRKNRQGGGVGLYFKNGLQDKILDGK